MEATSRDRLIHAATGCEDVRLTSCMAYQVNVLLVHANTKDTPCYLAGKHLVGALRDALAIIHDTCASACMLVLEVHEYGRTTNLEYAACSPTG